MATEKKLPIRSMFRLVSVVCLVILNLLFSEISGAEESIVDVQDDTAQKLLSGTVKGVVASAMILYGTETHEEKYMLFGINILELDMQQRMALKDRLSDLVSGMSAKLSVIRELGGLKYVRLFAPEDVVAKLISEGLAPWDRILASDESNYEERETFAKSNRLGIWSNYNFSTSKRDDDTISKTIDISDDIRFKIKGALKSLEFEAILDTWVKLEPSVRAQYRSNINQRSASRQGEKSRQLSQLGMKDGQLRQRQSENALEIQSNNSLISMSHQSEGYQTEEAFDDFDLNWNTDMLNSTIDRRNAQDSLGFHNPYTDITVQTYQNKVARDQARINSKTARISNRSQLERDGYSRENYQLNSQNSSFQIERNRIRGLSESVGSNLRWQTARYRNEIALFDRLDSAIKNGYMNASTFSPYEVYPDVFPRSTIRIPPTLRFVILNWEAPPSRSGIDLFRGTESFPFTRLMNNKPIYRKFYILEPGYEYVVRSRIDCRIELRYMDLLEPLTEVN